MDDHFSQLEDELRKLRPVGISTDLKQRVASTLDAASATNVGFWWQRLGFSRLSAALGWGLLSPGLGVAAAIVAVQVVGSQHPPAHVTDVPSTGSDLAAKSPLAAGTLRSSVVFYNTQDDGVVLDGTRGAVHRIRYRSADLVRWRNPETGTLWEVSYPREDVTLAPIHIE